MKNEVLQIIKKTLILKRKEKREDGQEESRKERKRDGAISRWGKLNLPRLKIQSWRFEKKEGGKRAKGKREDECPVSLE